MKKPAFWLVSLVIGAASFASSAEGSTSWLRTKDDCASLTDPHAQKICERVTESRTLLDTLEPRLIADKKGTVTEREIVIIAWDNENISHPIWLKVPFRVKKASEMKVTVTTEGYRVEHVRGTGLYKLQFRVFNDETELFVFGGKHVWVPHMYGNEWSHKKLSTVAETRQYIPSTQDHLYHKELVGRGKVYLETDITNAQAGLTDVPSRAVPGKSLSEVYPREMILNLLVTEHTDPYLLFGERKEGALPASSYFLGTLIEFALHGPGAFADLCSTAFACGWAQFTNKAKPEKNWPGTYNYTYHECRTRDGSAVLTEDFMKGTRDPLNAVKAAICYLDLENASLPLEARQEFLREPKSGSVYMLTAYNAGGGWSKRLFTKIKSFREKFKWSHVPLDWDLLPKSFFVWNDYYNEESHLYIKKYLMLWKLLYPEKLATVPIGTPRSE